MTKFHANHAHFLRCLCVIFALVCVFFVFSSPLHHCHGADCPVCALQELLKSMLPAILFAGLAPYFIALLCANKLGSPFGWQHTLVQLKVKLSD